MASKPSFMQVIKSVVGAFIGVQSEQQRKADFNSQTVWPFILAGVMLAVLFVLSLVFIVFLVLP